MMVCMLMLQSCGAHAIVITLTTEPVLDSCVLLSSVRVLAAAGVEARGAGSAIPYHNGALYRLQRYVSFLRR